MNMRDLPTIGSPWREPLAPVNEPLYAGLTIHEGKPAALILLPGDEDELTWDKAVAWAEKQGGTLPSRIDQLVLFKNLKSEFKQEAYWSAEQSAGDAGYAWYQYFNTGYQYTYTKDRTLRARAVRRVALS